MMIYSSSFEFIHEKAFWPEKKRTFGRLSVKSSSPFTTATIVDEAGARSFDVVYSDGVGVIDFPPRYDDFTLSITGEPSISYSLLDLVSEENTRQESDAGVRERTSSNPLVNYFMGAGLLWS